MKKNIIIRAISGVVIAILVSILASCFLTSVQPGYVGLIYNINGGIEETTLDQGMHFVLPWKKVKEYSVSIEQGYLSQDSMEGSETDDSFSVPTSDGKAVNVDLEYSYHFDRDKLPETYSLFKGQSGKEIEDTFIRGKLKTWSAEVTSNYSVIDLYGEKRTEINYELSNHMAPLFAEYGIVLDACNFSAVRPDDATTAAIQTRINKQQELETSKIEKEKASIEAESARIKAQGEADANKIISDSIDDKVLYKSIVDNWDGKLPVVVGNDGNMIDISAVLGQEENSQDNEN